MKTIKIIFYQTLTISTAVLLLLGIQSMFSYFTDSTETLYWPWYIPLSIILTGFLCAIPTLFLLNLDSLGRKAMLLRIFLHFIFITAIVALCGYLFKWYTSRSGFISIMVMDVLIYVFVWAATLWFAKSDEKKINEAIKNVQDEE